MNWKLGFFSLLSLALFSPPSFSLSNKEFKIGMVQEFENLNPMIMSMSATTYMAHMVNRVLVSLDADGKWYPQLAKQIPTKENGRMKIEGSGDKKYIVAKWDIVDSAKWGDGTPVTCQDFAFALQVAANPNISVSSKSSYDMIEEISWEPSTPKKCTFKYKNATFNYFHEMSQFYPLPKHIEESVFQKFSSQPEGYDRNSNYTKNPSLAGLYNGPYLISEVKLGSHVAFVPNPYFYGKPTKIQKVIVKLIPSSSTLTTNLKAGNIDMISVMGLSMDEALIFDKKVKAEKLPYQVLFQPSRVYEHIDLNLENPILKDVRVRQALMYGMNREEMVNSLFEGKQTVADHFIHPLDVWYTKDPKKINLYTYNKKEASRLLDEAGWKMGPNNLRTKDGQKLSFVFMTTAENKLRSVVQTYLQNQWKNLGIEIVIKNEPARVFFADTTRKRTFPALAMFAWTSAPESSPKEQLHSSQIPSKENSWVGQNYPGWKNAEVDKLLMDVEKEFDSKKRVKILEKILKHFTEEVPALPLFYRSDIAVIPSTLKNFRLTGHQYQDTNNIENWDLESSN